MKDETTSDPFAVVPLTKTSITKTVVFMLDYLTRANFMGPALAGLHEIRKILSEPTMYPLAIDASVQRANHHLMVQGIPLDLTMLILTKVPDLSRFIDDLDRELQALCPAYKALLGGYKASYAASYAARRSARCYPVTSSPPCLPSSDDRNQERTGPPEVRGPAASDR